MRARLMTFMVLVVTSIGDGSFAASSGKWMGFTEYPGARELCDEVVRGQGDKGPVEIHWRSFTSGDALADVIAFYARREGKNAQRSSDSLEVHRGADHILSAYAASKKDVPSCASKPNAGEKTIIMVSVRH